MSGVRLFTALDSRLPLFRYQMYVSARPGIKVHGDRSVENLEGLWQGNADSMVIQVAWSLAGGTDEEIEIAIRNTTPTAPLSQKGSAGVVQNNLSHHHQVHKR